MKFLIAKIICWWSGHKFSETINGVTCYGAEADGKPYCYRCHTFLVRGKEAR